jgi:hypothetical protein
MELEAEAYATKVLTDAGLITEKLLSDSRWQIKCEMKADLRAGFEPAPGVFEYLGISDEDASELLEYMDSLPRTTEFLRGGAS